MGFCVFVFVSQMCVSTSVYYYHSMIVATEPFSELIAFSVVGCFFVVFVLLCLSLALIGCYNNNSIIVQYVARYMPIDNKNKPLLGLYVVVLYFGFGIIYISW